MGRTTGLSLLLFSAAAAWLPLAPAHAQAAGACPGLEVLRADIEVGLRGLSAAHGYPGFAYAVAQPGRAPLSGGIGITNRVSRQPMRGDTTFQIGSVTKVFTGALLARLVAADRIGLGDPLGDHWFEGDAVPADPEGRAITIQALATHTSGLPRYPANLEREDGDPILGYSLSMMREALARMTIERPFPLAWDYSNFGYGVLAQAIERSQGRDFAELLAEEVLVPAGLADTAFTLDEDRRARLATPYRDDDVTVATRPWEMGALSAAGGLFSTAPDLAAFGAWLLRDAAQGAGPGEIEAQLLQQAPLVRFGRTTNWAYGLGIFVIEDYAGDVDVNWHGGDVDGYAGSLLLLPDHDLAIAYLTNIGFGNGFEEFQRTIVLRAAALCGGDR